MDENSTKKRKNRFKPDEESEPVRHIRSRRYMGDAEKIKTQVKPNSIQNLLLRLFSAWIFAVGFLSLTVKGASLLTVEYTDYVNITVMLAVMVLVFGVVSIYVTYNKSRYFDAGFLLAALILYTVAVIGTRDNYALLAGVLVFWAFVIFFTVKYRWELFDNIKINEKTLKVVIGFGAAFFICFVGSFGVFKYITYSSPNYDFGIFCQMFYYMRKSFLPLTTLERSTLLSHFAIHISPIYYLLLPGYLIFPSPIYLQIMQPVILASGIIPLYLLCKHYQLSNRLIICISSAFFMYPVLSAGCFYDLHENCFLLPLLLWFFYFAERRRIPLFYLFGVLVLFVKEDAFIYVFFAALFFIIGKRMYLHGFIMLVIAVVYFGFAMFLLYLQGYGAMVNRFSNFMPESGGGILDVVKTVFVNPALVIYESFETDKLLFLVTVVGTLGFLPLFIKKPQQAILLLPLVLINLMPDYEYQHSVYFQYNFGVAAFLFYLSVMNIKMLKKRFKRFMALFIVVGCFAGLLCCCGKLLNYYGEYTTQKDEIKIIDMYLEDIPSDASVISDTMFIPKLSQRDVIYERKYSEVTDADFQIFDMRGLSDSRQKEQEKEIETLIEKGYVKVVDEEGIIVILSAK